MPFPPAVPAPPAPRAPPASAPAPAPPPPTEADLLIAREAFYSARAVEAACAFPSSSASTGGGGGGGDASVVNLCVVVPHVPIPEKLQGSRILYPERVCGLALLVALASIVRENEKPAKNVDASIPDAIAVTRRAHATANSWFLGTPRNLSPVLVKLDVENSQKGSELNDWVPIFSSSSSSFLENDGGVRIFIECSSSFADAFQKRVAADHETLTEQVMNVLFGPSSSFSSHLLIREIRIGAMTKKIPMYVADSHCASACRTVTLREAAGIAKTRFNKIHTFNRVLSPERFATLCTSRGLVIEGDWNVS